MSHGTMRRTRTAGALLAFFLTVVLCLALPAAAFAVTSFGTPSPTLIGPQTALNNVTLQVAATDPASIKSATLKLDGVSKTPYVAYAGYWETDGCSSWFVPDTTQATIGFRPPSVTVGTHDVTVTVTNSANQTFTKAWRFVVEPAQTSFSAMSPASGAVASAWDVPISVQAADPVGLNDGPVLSVDGVPHTVSVLFGYGSGWLSYDEWNDWAYNYYPGPGPLDTTRELASFTPGRLSDGPHTASLAVTNSTGRTASTSWTFSVAAPPRISALTPGNGGVAASRTPRISASVADNGTIARVVMLLDGVEVPATYDAATGDVSFTPAQPLANDRTHSVALTATDAGGLSTTVAWSFKVQIYADMPAPGTCTDCHDATKHPMQNCGACHGPIPIGHGLAGDVSWCLTCHHTSGHGPQVIIPGVTWGGGDEPQPGYTGYWGNYCDYCHSAKYPTVPRHEADNAAAHATTTDMTSCDNCHVRELTREHFRRTGSSGAPLDCWTCHGEGAPTATKAAIASGDTSCAACHGAADHEALHTVDRTTDTCERCHAGTSLTNIHPAGSCDSCHASTDPIVTAAVEARDKRCSTCHGEAGHESLHVITPRGDTCVTCHEGESLTAIHATCATCHDSTKPAVLAAISSGNKLCSACHVTAGVDYHTTMNAAHIAPVAYYETCGHCHHGWGSNPIQGPNITRHAGGCVTCHGSGKDVTGKTAACDSCHGTAPGVYEHKLEPLYHEPQDATSLACADCHKTTDVRALHVTQGCGTCHVTLSCTECHKLHNANAAPLLVGTACANCHKVSGVDYHAGFAGAHTYAGMQASCQAQGCHSNQLVTTHSAFVGAGSRYPEYADTCALCHKNADPGRVPAGATAACDSCHGAGDHEALHVVDRTSDTCSGCHAGTSLTSIHASAGCAVCHSSTDAKVVAAIAAGTKTCSACHATEGVDYHRNIASHVTPASYYETCGHCHHGWGSNPLRGPDVRRHAGGCATCHNQTMDLTGLTTGCESCHGTAAGVYEHVREPLLHTPLDAGSLDCVRCHGGSSDVRLVHTTAGCATCHVDYTCQECHSVHGANTGTALLRKTSCSSCHATAGTDYHSAMPTAHTFGGMGADCQAQGCHVNTLVEAHAGLTGPGGRYPAYADACALCHLNADPSRVPAGATADCSSCHASADHAAMHVSSYSGACFSANCHDVSKNLITIHQPLTGPGGEYSQFASACALCHSNPAVDPRASGTGCLGPAACHTTMHASKNVSHTPTAASDTCTACHTGTLDALHVNLPAGRCAGCHDANQTWTKTADCASCHPAQPHPNLEATHAATMTSGSFRVFNEHEGYRPLSWDLQCNMCHRSSNLLSIHGNACATCHSGANPASSFTTWDKSCTQGACHPNLDHPLGDAAHNSYDCEYACHEANWDVYLGSCEWCHTKLAAAAPATVTNLRATYTGSASIGFHAEGVARTYYRLDGGPAVEGETCAVAGPATGSATHSVEYWSVSDAGVEEVHRSGTFAIVADATPPVTSSNVKASYVGVAVITLSVTDNDSNNTPTTYWRLDGGPVQSGRTVSVPQPVSGNASHVLEFWSVDFSGNAEVHKSVTFVCTADAVAPVTTALASPIIAKGSSYSLILTRTDPAPATGVTMTYYQVDGGGVLLNDAASATFPVNLGTGTHTVRFWSVDRAGNVEDAKSVTVIVDPYAPVTTSDGLATYTTSATIRLSPTDALSGVANTYYTLDGGVQQSGTSLTVTALGSHTLRYWSVDKAGNIETAKAWTFSVLADSPDRTAPTTTSDAKASYTAAALITLSAVDNAAGTGVAATYYRLDGGAQTAGTSISVPAPAQGTVTHTIEFWSVDKAGNTESPHKNVTFIISVPVTSGGTIRLVWGDNDTSGYMPIWDSWAAWTVRSGGATGPIVATGRGDAGTGWDGIDDVVVPVSTTPYYVYIDWWDADWGYEGPTIHPSVLVSQVGQVVTLHY